MSNMIDYLHWRGDLTFKQDPFNIVDNVILSEMLYTEFDEYLKEEEIITINELSDRYFKHHSLEEAYKSKSFINLAPVVLFEMRKTRRFKDLVIHNFKSELDHDKKIQFAALSIDIDNHHTYIAFRGTDDSLLGWHEDFDMTYQVIRAQSETLKYLRDNMRWNRKYYVGGHSKGGNLALYASVNIEERYMRKIIKIYDNDGPGLSKKMYLESDYLKVKERHIKIVPESDFFGMIFDKSNHHLVVASNESNMFQHNMLSWQVSGNQFIYKKEISESTKLFQKALNEYLDVTDNEQLKKTIDEIFDIIDDYPITNVSDLYKLDLASKLNMMKSLLNLKSENQETLHKLMVILYDTYALDLKTKILDKIPINIKGK